MCKKNEYFLTVGFARKNKTEKTYLKSHKVVQWIMYWIWQKPECFVLRKIKDNSQKLEPADPLKIYTLKHNKNYKKTFKGLHKICGWGIKTRKFLHFAKKVTA